MDIGSLLSGIGQGVLEVAKASAPLLVSGAVMKHGGKLTSWLPNDWIPFANGVIGIGIGVATTGDPKVGAQMGVLAGAGATGLHQVLKIGARALLEPILGGGVAAKVGPSERLSI
jgi:hypothetical protein